MMQKLTLEPAWEKTISAQDRAQIEQIFQHTSNQNENELVCSLIRTAINHKQQMLITVLIHNFSSHMIDFENREVRCLLEQGSVAQNFTIPALKIPSQTSMPWTFIFQNSSDFLFTTLYKVKIAIG